jgi:ABC-type multidrug transport system ATPase subunit
MTEIAVKKLSKRFGYQWIIRDFDHTFCTETIWGIAGNNGSGKSTIIKMLSGFLSPTSGSITHTVDGAKITTGMVYSHISLGAPYTDLINEYTLSEMFVFHQKFKKFKKPVSYKEFEEVIKLSGHKEKPLQHFSSGMKQKVQLALALLSDTPYLLLDEPTSFLDKTTKMWFSDLLHTHVQNRIVIIASNDPFDIGLCNELVEL